jgi:hypothetical protein
MKRTITGKNVRVNMNIIKYKQNPGSNIVWDSGIN